jgi:hypothetical protein
LQQAADKTMLQQAADAVEQPMNRSSVQQASDGICSIAANQHATCPEMMTMWLDSIGEYLVLVKRAVMHRDVVDCGSARQAGELSAAVLSSAYQAQNICSAIFSCA